MNIYINNINYLHCFLVNSFLINWDMQPETPYISELVYDFSDH